MILIAILICLAVQRFASFGGYFQMRWFVYYLNLLRPITTKTNPWIGLLSIVLPVFIVLWILHLFLAYKFFGVFYLVLACAILFFCMDARDLRSKFGAYFECLDHSDIAKAHEIAQQVIGAEVPKTEHELVRAVSSFMLLRGFSQLFAVLFWFIVGGVYAVLAYAIIAWLAQLTDVESDASGTKAIVSLAVNIQRILDWVSVRFLVLTYALGGRFKPGITYWRKHFQAGLLYNSTMVTEGGLAALDAQDISQSKISESNEVLSLIDRALIIWLFAAAIRVLIGLL